LFKSCNNANEPVTFGVAIEVPLRNPYVFTPSADSENKFTPTPTTSGLILPSSVGPQLLN